ncbi:MAG: tRNA (guanosine(37)-N1)-methyltransferase TrmD [Bacillati bacterium ANGP1]|uniref:tRNA (guanine-N(1)-)-methyltransferase n=1 Tax=Candidatus Segetimicrobium genomatis TaxID=2569760 RepID=A0A537K4G3_9BACT|nr:MAG: tRNA (guanosine(37)-N1)-methyltransferase TrmD [Terrabacteria group bacterium ANGP1]
MRVDVVTIFPEVFPGPLAVGVLGRARERGILDLRVWDLRDFTADRHRSVDDIPYGGGAGMVMKPEPFVLAVEAIRAADPGAPPAVLLTSPQGRLLTQAQARALAVRPHLVVLCGRYEGVDERVAELLGAEEISIGDYVLPGGEVAAMVLIEAVGRLLPGAVGDAESVARDSFSGDLLDYPQYTRPAEFRGRAVPEVLLSGHHDAIRRWRAREALRRTLLRRPEMIDEARLDDEAREILRQLRQGSA